MKESTQPIVSVVIPTHNRAALMLRAVKSALTQTLSEIEVIVVVDGPDPDSIDAIATINDPRLFAVHLPRSVGGSCARNIGIEKGMGEFVALLDDDDEWLPNKLSAQLAVARTSNHQFSVVTTRLIARRPGGDEIWPQRQRRVSEPMCEYLFCRENSFRQGEGFIQTSTLFAPRVLMLEVPFKEGLPRHQDWDWLMRAASYPGVEFSWVWEELVIYHIDSHRKSISSGKSAGPSISWINGNDLVTAKARAYFYATQVAVRCGSLASLLLILRMTSRYPRALLIGISLALAPRSLVSLFHGKGAIAPHLFRPSPRICREAMISRCFLVSSVAKSRQSRG